MKTKREGKFKSFLKKVVAGAVILSSIAIGKAVASNEQDYYRYLDQGKYQHLDKGLYNYEDKGKYQYMDRSMYNDKNLLNYLDKRQYESSEFFNQMIYQDYFRSTRAHPNPPQDGRIFTMPQTNYLAQSEYFRNLLGYENPSNYDMNFYLGRELFELSKRPENRKAFNELYRWQERRKEGLNAPVDDRAKDSLPIRLKPYDNVSGVLMNPYIVKGIKRAKNQEPGLIEKRDTSTESSKKFFIRGEADASSISILGYDPNSLSHADIMKLRNYEGSVFRSYLKNSSK